MELPSFLTNLDPNIYESQNYLVLDFEVDTSHGDFGRPIYSDNSILCASYKMGNEGKTKTVWGNELEQHELYEALSSVDFFIAHNSLYELGWLRRAGLDISRLFPFDTQLAEYVLLGNLVSGHADTGIAPIPISLDACARRRGWERKDPIVDILMRDGINPVSMPRKWVQDRCEQDVETTHALFKHQLKELRESNRLPVLYTRCLLTPVLASIQSEGMQLDGNRVSDEYNKHRAQLASLEQSLNVITGGINVNSPKQLGEFLYDKLAFAERCNRRGEPIRTATGKRATDVKTLAALQAVSPEQREFVELHKEQSRVSAALSKSLNFFFGICKEAGGLFYADFNQTRTATHRLSSSGITTDFGSVQFQNLARAFKRLFRAKRKGWFIAETDGSGLEFRIAGHLGDDAQIRADLADPDFDPHLTSLAEMDNVVYSTLLEKYRGGDKKTKIGRSEAKSTTFKPLFGGSQGTKKQEKWYKAFAERYHQLRSTQKSWVSEVLQSGHTLITAWGLRFYFPNARMNASGYCNVQNSVYNYPIQALATAEIIPIAVVYLWHRIHANGLSAKIKMVNTVHDSAVCEIAPDVVEIYKELAEKSFITDVLNYLEKVYSIMFTVPLAVEHCIGTYWGEED